MGVGKTPRVGHGTCFPLAVPSALGSWRIPERFGFRCTGRCCRGRARGGRSKSLAPRGVRRGVGSCPGQQQAVSVLDRDEATRAKPWRSAGCLSSALAQVLAFSRAVPCSVTPRPRQKPTCQHGRAPSAELQPRGPLCGAGRTLALVRSGLSLPSKGETPISSDPRRSPAGWVTRPPQPPSQAGATQGPPACRDTSIGARRAGRDRSCPGALPVLTAPCKEHCCPSLAPLPRKRSFLPLGGGGRRR